MQLSDILKDTSPINEAADEVRFDFYLRRLSELPDWKKREIERMRGEDGLSILEVMEIFNLDE